MNISANPNIVTVELAAWVGTNCGRKARKKRESFGFSKEVEPGLVGITLGAQDSGASIQIGGW